MGIIYQLTEYTLLLCGRKLFGHGFLFYIDYNNQLAYI
jgi:hypothetical protein